MILRNNQCFHHYSYHIYTYIYNAAMTTDEFQQITLFSNNISALMIERAIAEYILYRIINANCDRIVARSLAERSYSRNSWVCVLWQTGKFDSGVRYKIIFLYVQFWIRLAAVSYCGKKVWTVASSMVRSVNKSRDTRNSVQNEPEYAICVRFTTLLYHKALGIILCALIWQIRHNYNRLDDGHSDITGHRKMPWWQPMKIP